MTNEELIEKLHDMTDESDNDILSSYLNSATETVLDLLYPYGHEGIELPLDKQAVMIDIAVFMLNKRGAEGELSHSENGVSRRFASDDIPNGLRRRIIPKVGVL